MLKKEGCLFGQEIIDKLKTGTSARECVRNRLKMMRHYNEVGYMKIVGDESEDITGVHISIAAKKHPHIKEKLEEGYKVRRCTYVYFV